MSGPVTHRHDEMHRGLVPYSQLADGTPTDGQIPIWNDGDSVVRWGDTPGGTPAAEDVTFTPAGTIAATDAQAAIEEVATDAASALTGHTGDTTDAHDASAISADTTGYGNSSASDVQGVLDDFDAAITSASGGGGNVATDAIWDAKGDLALGTGSNTAAKLTAGSNGMVPMYDSAQSTGMIPAFIPGQLIAVNQYAPGTQQVKSRSSSTLAEVDTSNLRLTVTATASGKLVIVLSGFTDLSGGAGEGYWALFEGGSLVAGTVKRIMRVADAEGYFAVRFYLTGVSAGSHSYDWAFATGGSGTIRIIIKDGAAVGDFPTALMEAYAA